MCTAHWLGVERFRFSDLRRDCAKSCGRKTCTVDTSVRRTRRRWDGRIIQPSADGTVRAFEPDGTLACAYDTREPIRSSPAIDGDGNIDVGSSTRYYLIRIVEGATQTLGPGGTIATVELEERLDLQREVRRTTVTSPSRKR